MIRMCVGVKKSKCALYAKMSKESVCHGMCVFACGRETKRKTRPPPVSINLAGSRVPQNNVYKPSPLDFADSRRSIMCSRTFRFLSSRGKLRDLFDRIHLLIYTYEHPATARPS